MSDFKRPLFRKTDVWFFILILALALALFFAFSQKREGLSARISLGNEVVREVDLSEDKVIRLDGLPNVLLEVKDGAIAFIASDCPDKTCVNTGFLSRAGAFAACLPNGVSVAVVGDNPEMDAITR